MGARKGPACPQPGHPGRKRRVHRRPGCSPGPSQLTRGLRLPTGPQGGDMGGRTPPATPGRRLGSCPRSCKHHTHPHGRPTARLCPGRAWGAKASVEALSGLPRPWAPALTPRGQGAHSRCLLPAAACLTLPVPAGPTSSRQSARLSLPGSTADPSKQTRRPGHLRTTRRASARGPAQPLRTVLDPEGTKLKPIRHNRCVLWR